MISVHALVLSQTRLGGGKLLSLSRSKTYLYRTATWTDAAAATTVRLYSTTSSSSSSSSSSNTDATSSSSGTTTTTPVNNNKVTPKLKVYDTLSMDDIVSLCKRRGFIFPSSEIYNGFAGFFDYGPLGTELKRNVKDAWWKNFVVQRDDVFGLDSSIIHHPTTWKSSGIQ